MKCALNTGPDFHLLDHIAPLAKLFDMPLIVTEEKNFDLVRKYYPCVQTLYKPHLDLQLDFLAQNFDTLFECKYWAPHLKTLFRDLFQKEMRLVFCPHGFSDKTTLLPVYAHQDAVLLYGDLHIEMLQKLNLWPLKDYTLIGNYRLAHYQKHQAFYDRLAEKEVFSRFAQKQPTLLYAPTWQDIDSSTSFFDHARWVLSQIPPDWNLLVKVHPLLEQRNPAQYYSLAALFDAPNIQLLADFPPVYPLLARADAYLGDFSSVGYDFLVFQRPMLFLPNDRLPKGPLRSCGPTIDSTGPLLSQLSRDFSKIQKSLYQKAFASPLQKRFFN